MEQDIKKYLKYLYKKPMTVKKLCKKMGIYEKVSTDSAVNYRKIIQLCNEYSEYISLKKSDIVGSDDDLCFLTKQGKKYIEDLNKIEKESKRWFIEILIAILSIVVGILLHIL